MQPTKKEAGLRAFNSGLEMDMMSHAYDKYLEELIDEGKVDSVLLDESVASCVTCEDVAPVCLRNLIPAIIPTDSCVPTLYPQPDSLPQVYGSSQKRLYRNPALNGVGRIAGRLDRLRKAVHHFRAAGTDVAFMMKP